MRNCRFGLSVLLASSLMFVGCATTAPPERVYISVPAPVCNTVIKGITWSEQDTPDTIRQVKSNNAAYKAYCLTPKATP